MDNEPRNHRRPSRVSGERSAEHADHFGRLLDQHTQVLHLLDRAEAMRGLAQQMREQCGADIGLAGPVESGEQLVLRHWDGTQASGLHNLHVPAGLGLGGHALAQLQPVWVDDYRQSQLITHHFDGAIAADEIHTMLAVPMTRSGQVHGVVYAAMREITAVSGVRLDNAVTIANRGALALHTATVAERQRENAATAERRRIASALHDSVGAQLFHIGAEVRDLRSTVGDRALALLERLDSLEREIADAASAFRESVHALDDDQPSGPLASTLSADCAAFQRRTGTSAQVVEIGDMPELDSHRTQALITTAREALLNAEKHAQAESILVSLVAYGGGLALSITDDGNGCERVADSTGGLGLRTAADRLERVGGKLSTVTNEDAGVTVRAWVPTA